MKPRLKTLTLLLILAAMASAQDRPRVEKAKDRIKIQKDRQAIQDDRMDLRRLSDLVIKWDRIRQNEGPPQALKAIERKIAIELRRDLKENALQTEAAKFDVEESRAELRHSKRELRRERRDGDHRPAELMNEYRDRRDDRKDLSREIMEVKKHQKLYDQKRKVAAELFVLQKEIDLAGPRLDSRLQERQRTLLLRYLELSKQEIKLDLYKTHNDRQELYEDRRETRQDRRHR